MIEKNITQVTYSFKILRRNIDLVLVFSTLSQAAYSHKLCHLNYS